MAQMTQDQKQIQDIKSQFHNSLPVEITRVFRAPVDEVWQAWTTTELIKQWWGPETYTTPEARLEFREGGRYLVAMKGPDQKIVWGGGVIQEIVQYQKIVYTDSFTDRDGNPVPASEYGMTGDWPETLLVTVTFEKINESETRMSLLHEGIPTEMHDDCVQGWQSSFNKLQKLVERI